MYYDAVSRPSRFGATFGKPATNLQVRITSPAPGAVISRSSVLVVGEIIVPTAAEVGVTVNGIAGLVSNGQFAAKVPVDPSVTTLTATARDAAGNTGSDSIPFTVQPFVAGLFFLTASPSNGASPLSVNLRASFLGQATDYHWDTDGNGAIDISGPNLADLTQQYLVPGLYFPTVIVTNNQGAQFAESVPVLVYSQSELVALLQTKWGSIKDALRQGNVEGALNFVAEESRDRYRGIFNTLNSSLPQVDSILTNIQFGAVRENEVEFAMLRVSTDGVERSFYILFVRDNDGIWRLRTF